MKQEIIFDKYEKRGAYHWQAIDKSLKNLFFLNLFLLARYQKILTEIENLAFDKKILDVGCGDGALDWLIYKKTKAKIWGIDSSIKAIEIAQKKFKDLKITANFEVSSGYKLKFTSGFFDVVILADVIEHVQYPEKFLREIKRVLKPSGELIISSVIKGKIKEDKLHVKEFSGKEFYSLLNKYFKIKKHLKSHDYYLKKIYIFNFDFLSYQPQPFKYLANLLFLIIPVNLFIYPLVKPTCQTAVCYKK